MKKHLACTGVLLAAWFTAPTSADLVSSFYFSSSNFHVKLIHMPDLDQQRDDSLFSGLPGDGGMHCVPTADMNLFCYAANHGFPQLDPGPGAWQSGSLYGEATAAIKQLGFWMGTSSISGTNSSGALAGCTTWLSHSAQQGLLSVTSVSSSANYMPLVHTIAQKVANGGIASFCFGRYNVVDMDGEVHIVTRDGGHALTFVEAKRNASIFYVRYRDPGDDRTNTTQSPFVTKQSSITPILMASAAAPTVLRVAHAMDYSPSDSVIRLIDNYVVLQPLWVLSFTNNGGQYELTSFHPLVLGALLAPNIPMGSIFGVTELEIELDGATALALVQTSAAGADPKLRRFNMAEGTFVNLAVTNVKRFVTGTDGRIYATDGDKLYCYSPDGVLEVATSSIPVPTALAFDDKNKQVVVLSVPERKVARLTSALAPVGTFTVPAGTAMSGDGSVIVNPLDQHVLFTTAATNQLLEVTGLAGGYVFQHHSVSGLSLPKTLSPSDDGKVFVSTPSGLRVLVKTSDWNIDATSPFHNLAITGRMASQRSRSNIDPLLHDTPEWNNIDPDELGPIGVPVADCLSDFDSNDIVDGADLGKLLSAWGSVDFPNLDLNGDGLVDGADLGILLGEWGSCL